MDTVKMADIFKALSDENRIRILQFLTLHRLTFLSIINIPNLR